MLLDNETIPGNSTSQETARTPQKPFKVTCVSFHSSDIFQSLQVKKDGYLVCRPGEEGPVQRKVGLLSATPPICDFLKRFYLFIFREGKGGRKRERNISVWLPLTRPLLGTWPATQACALTGNRTGDPLVCRLAFSPLIHTSQG